ncbi:hypothetical protein M422DRAFT_45381 [Sphaerobolus stellatus SS14]|nr:hypothetical protein M422DRAFT_45381 [Sphaerobolus stellatus SS14]
MTGITSHIGIFPVQATNRTQLQQTNTGSQDKPSEPASTDIGHQSGPQSGSGNGIQISHTPPKRATTDTSAPAQPSAANDIVVNNPSPEVFYTNPSSIPSSAIGLTPSRSATTILPEIIPGYKVDTLDLPIPAKVKEVFRTATYVLYSTLTSVARQKAARGETSVVLDVATGGFTVKGLARSNEKLITEVEWIAAAQVAVGRTRHYHGKIRVAVLASHHNNVINIAQRNGWETAMEYDVQQREISALHPQHDLSSIDAISLSSISSAISSTQLVKLLNGQQANHRQSMTSLLK